MLTYYQFSAAYRSPQYNKIVRYYLLFHNWRLRTGRRFQNLFKNNIIHTLIVTLFKVIVLLLFIIDIKHDTDTTVLFSIIYILGIKLNII